MCIDDMMLLESDLTDSGTGGGTVGFATYIKMTMTLRRSFCP